MFKIESVGVIAAIGQLEKWTTANGQTGCAKAIEVQELDGHRKDSLIITYRFGAVVELEGLKVGDVIRFECFVKTRSHTRMDRRRTRPKPSASTPIRSPPSRMRPSPIRFPHATKAFHFERLFNAEKAPLQTPCNGFFFVHIGLLKFPN